LIDLALIDPARLAGLEERLGHKFADTGLLARALMHASADSVASNERLEFLGDRVLALVLAERLHGDNPSDNEGSLALKFNAMARGETCASVAEAAGLADYVVLAAGEAASGGRRKAAILAGVCEAVIAALYLDGGLAPARMFIERYWDEPLNTLGADMRDPKTTLQEWAQSRERAGRSMPVYRQVRREGPDHAPRFWVEVTVAGEPPETGEGASKREAEQAAAAALLARLRESTQ
jgi:ribonuclease-3